MISGTLFITAKCSYSSTNEITQWTSQSWGPKDFQDEFLRLKDQSVRWLCPRLHSGQRSISSIGSGIGRGRIVVPRSSPRRLRLPAVQRTHSLIQQSKADSTAGRCPLTSNLPRLWQREKKQYLLQAALPQCRLSSLTTHHDSDKLWGHDDMALFL